MHPNRSDSQKRLEMFVKVENNLEDRLEKFFENYVRHQRGFTTTTRAHDRDEAIRVCLNFLFILLDR